MQAFVNCTQFIAQLENGSATSVIPFWKTASVEKKNCWDRPLFNTAWSILSFRVKTFSIRKRFVFILKNLCISIEIVHHNDEKMKFQVAIFRYLFQKEMCAFSSFNRSRLHRSFKHLDSWERNGKAVWHIDYTLTQEKSMCICRKLKRSGLFHSLMSLRRWSKFLSIEFNRQCCISVRPKTQWSGGPR